MSVTEQPRGRVQLALEGRTSATCAARIERRLNKLDGVEASVDYAGEQAAVVYDPERIAVEDLPRAVEAAGYRAYVSKQLARAAELAVALARREGG